MHLGSLIERKLKEHGLTQAKLSGKTGLSASMISHYVCGLSLPSAESIFALCNALEVDIEEMVDASAQDHKETLLRRIGELEK